MTPQAFLDKRRNVELKERSAAAFDACRATAEVAAGGVASLP